MSGGTAGWHCMHTLQGLQGHQGRRRLREEKDPQGLRQGWEGEALLQGSERAGQYLSFAGRFRGRCVTSRVPLIFTTVPFACLGP